ncbi:hypothetical protein [Streptomyces sp. NPDC006134]|uniref:hypothetical protein n=1 Tax=Streptomyces sp. NPDC006134 TaxID=3154467 RepID=UPI0033FE229B
MAERTEEHLIRAARNDAAYALVMVERPETTRADLCLLVRKLAGAVNDVASVADLRGERLNSPAAKALERALLTAFGQR